jgi:Uma2 family endonuclease
MGMPAETRRRWTAREVEEMQQADRPFPRYELIDGELLVTPSAPLDPHQAVVGELYFRIADYLRSGPKVKVWLSPADIRLEPETIVQPDIFVAPRVDTRAEGWLAIKSLVLAVEVLSAGSLKHDRVIKRQFYQRCGVSDYWIVDVDNRRIESWRPDDRLPEVHADRLEWLAPSARMPLVIDVQAMFAEALRP